MRYAGNFLFKMACLSALLAGSSLATRAADAVQGAPPKPPTYEELWRQNVQLQEELAYYRNLAVQANDQLIQLRAQEDAARATPPTAPREERR